MLYKCRSQIIAQSYTSEGVQDEQIYSGGELKMICFKDGMANNTAKGTMGVKDALHTCI